MQPASNQDLAWIAEQGLPAGDVLGVEQRGAQVAIAFVKRGGGGLGQFDDDGLPAVDVVLVDSPAAIEVIEQAVEFAEEMAAAEVEPEPEPEG